MTATSTLHLTRRGRKSTSGTSTRLWRILIDGSEVATIADSETVNVSLEPGHHSLRVSATRLLRSPDVTLDVIEGQHVGMSCRPRSPNPVHLSRWVFWVLASLARPGLWIDLNADDPAADSRAPRDPVLSAAGASDAVGGAATSPRTATLSPEFVRP